MFLEATRRSVCRQAELFEQAATFEGRPRERIVALAEAEELCFRLYPYDYRALQVIRVASQLGKVARARKDGVQECESRLISLLLKVIVDGTRVGDLCLGKSHCPEELALRLWALAFGTRSLVENAAASRQLAADDAFRIARKTFETPLDAPNWRPLLTEWDNNQTRHRIHAELFPAEWRGVSVGPAPRIS